MPAHPSVRARHGISLNRQAWAATLLKGERRDFADPLLRIDPVTHRRGQPGSRAATPPHTYDDREGS
jgi:hypothetical protein